MSDDLTPPPDAPPAADPDTGLTWELFADRSFAEPELLEAIAKVTAASQGVPFNFMLLIALTILGTVTVDAPPVVHELVRSYLNACKNRPGRVLAEWRRVGLALGMTPRLYTDPTGGTPQ